MNQDVRWKRNLTFIWVSQFLSIGGFMFCLPFAPFYIQKLGVTDPLRLKIAVALFGMATPFAMAFAAPVWGGLADRYGRRIMLLRATSAAVWVLGLMGLANSVAWLIALRLMQGMFTGTMTAAQAMVAVHTPHNRSGLALGSLSAAVFSGGLVGSFLGGVTAELFGYRAAFFIASAMMLGAFLCILLGTREDRPDPAHIDGPLFRFGMPKLHGAMPIVLLICLIALARHFDQSYFPLLVQDIHGGIEGASMWTGVALAVCSVAGMMAGLFLGRLADRIPPPRIAIWSAAAAILFVVPHTVLRNMYTLLAVRGFLFFCVGGLDPVFQIWLAKSTPADKRASVFGWACSAKCFGWMLAPIGGGAVAAIWNIRAIYAVNAVIYIVLIVVIANVVRWMRRAPSHT